MYSSYTSSTIAFRTNGSVPFCSNDYYLLNERVISKIASSSCSPCSCCAFCFHGGVPLNPRFLYGLRQVTLLNWSASRRLIFGAEGRYYRLFASDYDRSCCGDTNFGRESFSGRRRKGRGKGRRDGEFGFRVWEERRCEVGVDGTAEAMLGLLTEQVDEKLLLGVREPSRKFTSGKVHLGERQRDITNKRSREEKKNLELDSLEMHSEIKVESRGSEVSSRHENSKLRKEGSSCSSYYSVLSSEEIDDSDVDTQVKNSEFISGLSSRHKNKEMRSGEVVVADYVREDFEKYEDHDAEFGETLTYKNAGVEVSVGSAVDQDVRNCKEKKFIEVSVGEKESRMESSWRDSSMMESHETVAEKASASQKQFHARKRNSALSSNLAEEIGEKQSQSGRKVIQQSVPMRKSHQLTETTQIRGSDSRTSSSSQIQLSGREENLSASQKVVQEAREKHNQRGQCIIRENKESLKSQSETKKLAHDINLERTSHSKTISESGLNDDTVENSAFLQTSVHDSREQRTITDRQFVGKTETREELQDLTNISASCSIDTKKVVDSKEVYETRLDTRKEKSVSTMDLTQEARGRSSERVVKKVGLRNSKRPSELSSSWESSTEGGSGSQTPARQQLVAAQTEGGRNSKAMVLPPPSQFVARPSQETIGYQKTASRHAQQNVSLEFSGSGSITLQTEDETPGFPHEHDGQMRRDEIYGDHPHNDALDSANRLEESSKQFVGEFAEKLQHVVMISKVEEEKISSEKTSVYRNGKYTQQGSSQKVSEDFHSQVQFPGESSVVSGTKGPSDEMWDVAGPIPQERSEEHEEVSPGTEIAIMKRSSRSLWSLIADIVRMRWHTRSETHSIAMKSAERTSSNESVTSDAWFSSHEADDKIDENVVKGKRRMKKEDRPKDQSHLGEASSQSQGKVANESDMSSSLGTAESGSPFEGGASLASQEENFGDKQETMKREGIHSTIVTADSSLPVHSRRLIRSPPPVKNEISQSSKVAVSGTGFTEVVEQPVLDRLKDTSASEPKDGELKRRKLQRSKQVLTERFEEWEEAYRLESEQRKIDEMFMREALLEARKAADTWEVPVGAVLVQHGKIIARGCNLVEELRDSTAHAEMICIREASNLLRSWRLPDTTLYVTLEPCAMCAGAILQARIDTVVWGAPNKLLGADGSWVRLFPGGPESSTSDLTDQPAGPVHPFHPKMAIRRGVLATECSEVMQQFFQLRRKKKKADPLPPSCLPVSTHPSKFFTKIHDIFSIMFCL